MKKYLKSANFACGKNFAGLSGLQQKMNRINFIAVFLFLLGFSVLFSSSVNAQSSKGSNTFGGVVKLDKTVHDFGDILVSDGPVSVVFTATNISGKPMVIYNVVSSCGCTDVEWTRQPIKAGEKGTIKATYNNDGAYPFDKTLTVYFSGVKQPVVLRLKGESHDKKLSLKEMYTTRFGDFAFKSVDIKCGNLSQGQQKSGEVVVANLGSAPINVSFADVSDGLSLKVSPNPVPANSTARLLFTVTADRSRWGKNYYYATPVVNGSSSKATVSPSAETNRKPAGTEAVVADPNPELGSGRSKIGVFAVTKEDFSSWTKEQKDNGSSPIADESTYSFGKVTAGKKVTGSFAIANQGKSSLRIYKTDSESPRLKADAFPDLAAGKKGSLGFTLDTKGMPKGEAVLVMTVTTNSPLRPIMNLFVTGWIN